MRAHHISGTGGKHGNRMTMRLVGTLFAYLSFIHIEECLIDTYAARRIIQFAGCKIKIEIKYSNCHSLTGITLRVRIFCTDSTKVVCDIKLAGTIKFRILIRCRRGCKYCIDLIIRSYK